MGDIIKENIKQIINECFWGDYHLDPIEVETRIKNKDDIFCKFFVHRIISGSPFPSARLKALFDPEYLKKIIDELTEHGRLKELIRIIKSVLFREPEEGYRPWTSR
ncbi:MAG: hypothetical protein JW969_20295 [Spirochaetales bacterium]|nr:hypothetical protein [Spirochaetales bacterium]